MKQLVVYFSHRGENYAVGNIQEGNAEHIAKVIQRMMGADIFEIETQKPYSKDYHACTKEALEELQSDARPALKEDLKDIREYDVIYLCYPNWWGTYPRAVATFLDHHDFSDKIIMPMCTHEGNAMGESETGLRKALPNSIIKKGLAIKGTDARNSDAEIERWLRQSDVL